MKKYVLTNQTSAVLGIFLGIIVGLPATVRAQYDSTTNNGTITITGYPGPSGAVTIPAIITGLPVTSIGDSAFLSKFCDQRHDPKRRHQHREPSVL